MIQMATVRRATDSDKGDIEYTCSDINDAAVYVEQHSPDLPEGYHYDIYFRCEKIRRI